ncbi:hypothetical protein HBB16_10205 [Pseudonocardia sp. MCCB 268]|nr:hypothetical protein [Pseudonocardia cytotoxica]
MTGRAARNNGDVAGQVLLGEDLDARRRGGRVHLSQARLPAPGAGFSSACSRCRTGRSLSGDREQQSPSTVVLGHR